MTGHDADYIWRRMPLAQGRQYEQLFYGKYDIPCVRLGIETGKLSAKIK